jgi:hypothetical protein
MAIIFFTSQTYKNEGCKWEAGNEIFRISLYRSPFSCLPSCHWSIANSSVNCGKTTAMIKYTTQFLAKLEDLVAESDYILRYEKGNFKAGYCLLKEQKIMIINKFFTTEGKINALLDIFKTVALDTAKFSEKNVKFYEELVKELSKSAVPSVE